MGNFPWTFTFYHIYTPNESCSHQPLTCSSAAPPHGGDGKKFKALLFVKLPWLSVCLWTKLLIYLHVYKRKKKKKEIGIHLLLRSLYIWLQLLFVSRWWETWEFCINPDHANIALQSHSATFKDFRSIYNDEILPSITSTASIEVATEIHIIFFLKISFSLLFLKLVL